ncbi:MAG: cobalt-precorrin-5B (C(1))-methyltransferase [Desulfobacteraceae bacterium]|nr:cobalt-precorrin-5B (C(1))-methyltransferase [Desulfobacteraceae bacterium]
MAAKELKQGFTTGAAAAASVKAALLALTTSQTPVAVDIEFLNGEEKSIAIKKVLKLSDTCCQASVIKDAGDDPDITHKAEIGAKVTLSPAKDLKVIIQGGQGVGKVTKPGLEVEVGEPAINGGPRQMIQNVVEDICGQYTLPGKVTIEVFVPQGELLAKKTLNARLGIIGGISILGTTGIVRPLSHDAYIATIKSSISVATARGIDTLVFTTGRRSERFAMGLFPAFLEEAFIQTGDFFKAAIDEALDKRSTQEIIYTIFFGKAVKMSLGFKHTHAAKSELTLNKLAHWSRKITGDEKLFCDIKEANTARHAFSYIFPDYPELLTYVGNKIRENARGFAGNRIQIRVIILDFDGNVVFDSRNIKEIP